MVHPIPRKWTFRIDAGESRLARVVAVLSGRLDGMHSTVGGSCDLSTREGEGNAFVRPGRHRRPRGPNDLPARRGPPRRQRRASSDASKKTRSSRSGGEMVLIEKGDEDEHSPTSVAY